MPVRYETLADALLGTEAPFEIVSELSLIEVPYIDFEGESQIGQLIIHQELCEETQSIFAELHKQQFPIHKMVPAAAYGWDDEASMADNNTSAFNYRAIIATDRLSNHSLGRAIDINPLLNPYFARNGKIYPRGASYEAQRLGTLTKNSSAVELFKRHGWIWLGERHENTDYQHFEKSNR